MLIDKVIRRANIDSEPPANIMELLRKEKCKENILLEKLVDSSWLKTVTYFGPGNKIFPGEDFITFKTKMSPTTYICRFYIPGECKRFYKRWIDSESKGAFWWWVRRLIRRDWFKTIPHSNDKYGVPKTAKPFQIIKY